MQSPPCRVALREGSGDKGRTGANFGRVAGFVPFCRLFAAYRKTLTSTPGLEVGKHSCHPARWSISDRPAIGQGQATILAHNHCATPLDRLLHPNSQSVGTSIAS